jgi:mycofactocin precursor
VDLQVGLMAGTGRARLNTEEVSLDTAHDEKHPDLSGSSPTDEPAILEEIEVEDLTVDGICGVY